VFDKKRLGRVSFHDWCTGCREVGYWQNMRSIHHLLTANTSTGFVTLEALQGEVGPQIDVARTHQGKVKGSTSLSPRNLRSPQGGEWGQDSEIPLPETSPRNSALTVSGAAAISGHRMTNDKNVTGTE
jgi:hypothetical protein